MNFFKSIIISCISFVKFFFVIKQRDLDAVTRIYRIKSYFIFLISMYLLFSLSDYALFFAIYLTGGLEDVISEMQELFIPNYITIMILFALYNLYFFFTIIFYKFYEFFTTYYYFLVSFIVTFVALHTAYYWELVSIYLCTWSYWAVPIYFVVYWAGIFVQWELDLDEETILKKETINQMRRDQDLPELFVDSDIYQGPNILDLFTGTVDVRDETESIESIVKRYKAHTVKWNPWMLTPEEFAENYEFNHETKTYVQKVVVESPKTLLQLAFPEGLPKDSFIFFLQNKIKELDEDLFYKLKGLYIIKLLTFLFSFPTIQYKDSLIFDFSLIWFLTGYYYIYKIFFTIINRSWLFVLKIFALFLLFIFFIKDLIVIFYNFFFNKTLYGLIKPLGEYSLYNPYWNDSYTSRKNPLYMHDMGPYILDEDESEEYSKYPISLFTPDNTVDAKYQSEYLLNLEKSLSKSNRKRLAIILIKKKI